MGFKDFTLKLPRSESAENKREGKLIVFYPLKDGTSRSPSWWPTLARYKEDYAWI